MRRVLLSLAALILSLSACSGGSAAESTSETTSVDVPGTTEAVAATTVPDPTTTTTEGPPVFEVIAEDYSFSGVPEVVEVGTEFSIRNNGTEIHRYVIRKIPDHEERSVEILLALPLEELVDLAPVGDRIMVATPGATGFDRHTNQSRRVIDEPGRYVMICDIRQGTRPVARGSEVWEFGDGPFHYTLGMWVEFTAENSSS